MREHYVTRLTRPVDIVEAAYDMRGSTERWLDGIVRAAVDDLDAGRGVYAMVSEIGDGVLPIVSPIASRGVAPEFLATLSILKPPAGVTEHIRSRVVIFGSMVAALGHRSRDVGRFLREDAAIGDSIGALAQDGEGRVLQIIATSHVPARIHPGTARAWRKILLHLGTALRLRWRLGASPAPTAVLTPGGRVEHASGEAQGSAPRALLVSAVRDIERARTRRIRGDADEALALWRGLVAGRWSLVDHFESDGRRYLVAHENTRSIRDPRALTALERDSLDYYLGGASTTEIAFAFGRSAATVGTALSRIAKRLGFPSRAALRRASPESFARLTIPLAADERVEVLVVDDVRVHERWREVLGQTALEVATLAARGLTDGEIAERRARSTRTVSNQLRAVYRLVGVRGRTALLAALARAPNEPVVR